MSIKQIITYNKLRSQLTEQELFVADLLLGANESDRQLLIESLQPERKASRKSATKTRTYQRCEQCGKTEGHAFHKDSSNDGYHVFQPPTSSESKSSQSSSKSPRASGMAAQLSNRRQRQQKISEGACVFVLEDGAICNTGDNNPIHDESFGYAHYHPFQPSTTAPPAPVPSPANGGATTSTANSEIAKDVASTVAHGASGGD